MQEHRNIAYPEKVKLYISRKSPQQNGYKENLIEAYDKFMKSTNLLGQTILQKVQQKRQAPKEELINS